MTSGAVCHGQIRWSRTVGRRMVTEWWTYSWHGALTRFAAGRLPWEQSKLQNRDHRSECSSALGTATSVTFAHLVKILTEAHPTSQERDINLLHGRSVKN